MPKRYATPKIVTLHNPEKAYPGYTLFGGMGGRDVWLMNMEGEFVHRWKVPDLLGVHGRLLPNGHLLVGNRMPNSPVADMAASGGDLIELDWDGNVVWRYENLYINHHDFYRMENGNTLISVWIPIPESVAKQIKGGRPGSEREGIIWSDCLQEITPDGQVIWEWKAYEHMDLEKDTICPLCSRVTWSYINSIFVIAGGDILISIRVLNAIAIIDKTTGKIRWRWGAEEIGHQHNPTMLGNGNILLFDNGLHCQSKAINPSRSRVIEVNPQTEKIEWEYVDPDLMSFYSPICAGAQRLPNGNTLICEATKGRIFEVTPKKETVWECFSPFYFHYRPEFFGEYTNMVYRAHRYSPDYPGLKGKDLQPGRFEWVLQEKGKPEVQPEESKEKEKAVQDRLAKLGY